MTRLKLLFRLEAENKPNITQYIVESDQKQKYEHLLYLLDSDQYKRVMIFCNTKDMTAQPLRTAEKSWISMPNACMATCANLCETR